MSGGTIGLIFEAIGAFSSLASVFGSSRSSAPTLPTFTIPAEDLATLNDQIKQNTAISEQARTAAVAALQNYNQGILSPSYQSMYNEYANEATKRTMQELAARGFTEGSSEYTRVMSNLGQALGAYKGNLLKTQLSDAINMSNLSEGTINDLYKKWTAESTVTTGQANTMFNQAKLDTDAANSQKSVASGIGAASKDIGDIFGKATSGSTTSSPSTTVSPVATDNSATQSTSDYMPGIY